MIEQLKTYRNKQKNQYTLFPINSLSLISATKHSLISLILFGEKCCSSLSRVSFTFEHILSLSTELHSMKLYPAILKTWLENYIIILLKKSIGEKRLVKFVKILDLNVRSINAIQKYPHFIESYPCVIKIFTNISLLLLKNFLIHFGISSTPK